MGHIPFDIICRIADGEISQQEIELYLNHWKSCPSCQKETDLQRSIMNASRKVRLINPSDSFTQDILNVINPSQKKKWSEWFLHNMGNIIAMALVLAFLGYIFSITETGNIQKDKSSKMKPITEFVKIIKVGSQQFSSYITSRIPIQSMNTIKTNTTIYAILAIILLIFIDRIIGYFLRQFKLNL